MGDQGQNLTFDHRERYPESAERMFKARIGRFDDPADQIAHG